MNKFGMDLLPLADNRSDCNHYLSSYLKQGCLGLLLGAGASMSIGLPSWSVLVKRCHNEQFPDDVLPKEMTNEDLKKYSQIIKDDCLRDGGNEKYIKLLKEKMYDGITLDFSVIKKDLLIAITTLVIGRTRATVRQILTYNFDSILEWYLMTNGLKVVVAEKKMLFNKYSDVEITHLHGYIPFNEKFGDPSDHVVFSKHEFEDRDVQYDYWKIVLDEFWRHNVFLTIGLSAETIINDICKYLRNLDRWYENEKIVRSQPYGFAFLTPNEDEALFKEQKEVLLRHGIIPCTYDKDEIPTAIFNIAQTAAFVDYGIKAEYSGIENF